MKLILVTSTFPYGTGETFIENEIDILAENFEQVFIFPCNTAQIDVTQQRELPDNVSAFFYRKKQVRRIDYIKSLFSREVWFEINQNCTKENRLRKVMACCHFTQEIQNSSRYITDFLEETRLIQGNGEGIIVYSYWLHSIGAVALRISSRLEAFGYDVKKVSRAHGFDLYTNAIYPGYQPFQWKLIEKLDCVYPCSLYGKKYLLELYPTDILKIKTAYLGIKDNFKGRYPVLAGTFCIVSCSQVIPVKRVERIVDALHLITNIRIRWIHFGGGEGLQELIQKASYLKSNIECYFPGHVSNSDILRFYQNENVNMFINLSLREGLPVSVMEALSFGIPAIATIARSTDELICDGENGYILKNDFSNEQCAEAILKVANSTQKDYCRLCKNARIVYEEKFNAQKNYESFVHGLMTKTEFRDEKQ